MTLTLTPKRIGLLLAIATTVLVLVNQRSVGIARDETVYFTAGDHYADWWVKTLTFRSHATIAQTFGGAFGGEANPEHPPLLKLASGLSHRWLPFAGELTAYRLPSAILHGVCAYLVFAFALELWGLAEAVLAALCLIVLPRALFHAGLDCFDAPSMALWFATIYAYWRCLDGRRWPWQVGVAWGLALATKHTALLLPFALGVHLVAISIRARRIEHWRVVISLAVLGPLTLFVLWPWLWSAPIAHVRDWLAFHMHHVHYNFEYLGVNWNAPPFPWHVAIVTTLLTVPAATLVAAVIGACVMRKRGELKLPSVLLLVSACASIGPFFLGTTPIFGAEKHWMPILPTLCIAAGVGAAWAARKAGEAIGRPRIATIVVGGGLVLAGASEVIAAEPYALTWYSALAGGDAGGADLGMNRQFWGVAARGVLAEIAKQPPAPVYTHDASPAWGWYQRLGLVPKGYPDAGHEAAGIAASKLAIVIHEKHFNRHDYMIWKAYGTVQPIFVLRANGVPIVSLYKRP
ncbi:MAG TPA: glycosyltransferase family 39 protein [Kofleriaceae bacterium]|nr:glycosyltransferase family 39 protein [Kofleriaceae bacterium]